MDTAYLWDPQKTGDGAREEESNILELVLEKALILYLLLRFL